VWYAAIATTTAEISRAGRYLTPTWLRAARKKMNPAPMAAMPNERAL